MVSADEVCVKTRFDPSKIHSTVQTMCLASQVRKRESDIDRWLTFVFCSGGFCYPFAYSTLWGPESRQRQPQRSADRRPGVLWQHGGDPDRSRDLALGAAFLPFLVHARCWLENCNRDRCLQASPAATSSRTWLDRVSHCIVPTAGGVCNMAASKSALSNPGSGT
jgi:hypothetical protein